MKSLTLLLSCLICSVYAADALTADEILLRIDRQGGRKVLWDLWEHDAEFSEVLAGIETANRAWVRVASRLRPFSDAGASEDLDYAVARALPHAPERILSLVGHGFELRFVCTSPFNEPERGVAEAYERKTLTALAAVQNPDLKPLATECAKLVKLPVPGA